MSVRCAEHGKARTLANLIEIGNGEYTCKPESRCKVPQPAAPTPYGASPYGGTAAAAAATTSYGQYGGYYPGYGAPPEAGAVIHQAAPAPTSTAELLAQGHAIINPEKPEMCHAHGKVRSPQQLYQVMTPAGPKWECLLETRCKTTSSEQPYDDLMKSSMPGMYQRYSPYGMSVGGNGGMMGRQAGRPAVGMMNAYAAGAQTNEFCYLHGKKRSAAALEMQADGSYRCKPSSICKTKAADAGNTAMCASHQKNRKLEYLVSDGKGGYVCAPQYACQGGPQ